MKETMKRSSHSSNALKMGLVNHMVLPKDLKTKTEELCHELSNIPPIAVQMTKKAVIHAYQNDLLSHMELMAAYQGITQRSSDHFKALDGMIDKTKQTFDHR